MHREGAREVSHLLELLGRGLGSDIGDLLDRYYWTPQTRGLGELEQSCRDTPDWPDLRLQLALAYMRALQHPQAIEHLAHACRHKPDFLPARLALAAALEQQGEVEKALAQLRIANQVRPGEAPVLFAMGFCCERLGRHDQAAEYYRDALGKDGSFVAARERLAAVAVLQGSPDTAVEQYEALRTISPQDPTVRSALAHLYHRAGRELDAVREFEQAIAMEPENWALADDEVESLVATGQVREAIERLHTLLERQGDFPDLHLRLGDLYAMTGDDAAALKHYHAALDAQPRYLEANVKLGTQHLAHGRWELAAEAFHRGCELNDHLLLNYVGMAVSYWSAGRRQESQNALDLAAAIEPNSTLLLSEMARLQLKAAAAQEFQRTFDVQPDAPAHEPIADNEDLLAQQTQRHACRVQTNPRHADLRYRYGVLLRAQGCLGEAMTQFAQAVEINPAYVQALVKLGITQQELGLTDQAMETFRRALDLRPQYVDLHYRLGLLYTDRRRFDEALREMEAAAGGAPNNEQVRAGLALSLQNMGLMDRAAAQWRSLWKTHAAGQAAEHRPS